MKIMKQAFTHNFSLVAVQKFGKIFLLFTPDAIYAYGDEKDVDAYIKRQKGLK